MGEAAEVLGDDVERDAIREEARRDAAPALAALEEAAQLGLEHNLREFLRFLGMSPWRTLEMQTLGESDRFAAARCAYPGSAADTVRLADEADRRRPVGVYFMANEPDAIVATRGGRSTWRVMGKGESTTDADMVRRWVLFFDFDFERATNTSATDDEVRQTFDVMERARSRFLRNVPAGAVGIGHSGNGASLMVALAGLPETPELAALVKGILEAAHRSFSDPAHVRDRKVRGVVGVDTTVSDAKRLCPAFGTTKRKGSPDVPERPHRRTAFLAPVDVVRVGVAELEALLADLEGDLDDEGRAAVAKAMGRRPEPKQPPRGAPPPPRERQIAGDDPFATAKALEMRDVLLWLGLMEGEQPVCPGCSLCDQGVAIVGTGLKCSHDRCADRGVSAGYRTTVDVVVEARGVTPIEAVRLLGEQFGFEVPAAKKKSPREQAKASGASAARPVADKDRPTIEVTSDLEDVVHQVLEVLPGDPQLYQRGGQLVRIVHDAEPKGSRAKFAVGTPRLRAVDPAVLTYRVAALAKFTRWDARTDEMRNARPDSAAVSAVASLGEWPGVRPIVGVAEAPILQPAGTIFDVAGYDEVTGYVYEPSADFGRIPDRPSREDARRALAELSEPFAEFPWAKPAGLMAAVSAVLTLLARPAIDGPVPAVLFDKNTPGTGGSLCTDVVALIATGRPAPRMSWPEKPEECGKILDAYALRSPPLVNFDNITPAVPFTGASLDKYLTADVVELRILGRTEAPCVLWRALIMGSGNNISVTGDTVRRVVTARMETALERPQDRDGFRILDLRAWCRLHRVRLVRAALTVLRAYIAAGRPSVGLKPWGSFEAWTALVPSALVWAGGASPLDARLDTSDGGDPELAALAAILAQWPRVSGPNGETLRTVLARLYPGGKAPPRERDPSPDEQADDALREALEVLASPPRAGGAPDAKKLGANMRRFLRVVRGGLRLATTPNRDGIAVWSVEAAS